MADLITPGRPYADSAGEYLTKGWNPIPVAGKSHPISGYTGKSNGQWTRVVTDVVLAEWLVTEGHKNVGHRHVGTIAVDVDDDYNGKWGAQTLAAMQEQLGALPPTVSSTARGAGSGSRQYFFRIPADREELMTGADKRLREGFGRLVGGEKVTHIEIIHRGHRYSVIWPSVHPDTQTTYTFYDAQGQAMTGPPSVSELPELPQPWLDYLAPLPEAAAELSAASQSPLPQVYEPSLSQLFAQPVSDGSWTPEQAAREIESCLSQIAASRQGQGQNGILNSASLRIGRFVGGGFLTREEAEERITAAFLQVPHKRACSNCPGTMRSGLDAGVRQPMTLRVVPTPVEDDVPQISSWQHIDLTDVLNGEYVPLQPTLGRRQDGQRLLYAGKEHSVSSEPECGKTWLVLMLVLDILIEGGRVLYLDFEDDENTIVHRLLSLGCPRSLLGPDTFRYARPVDPPPAGVITYECTFGNQTADLMVLDGVTEGMGSLGLDPLSQKDIVLWRRVAKEAMKLGTAVLSTDHETKNKDTRGRYAIGGQHKLAGLNGVMFKMQSITPFTKDGGGRSRILISKDRNGALRNVAVAEGDGMAHVGDLVCKDGQWHVYPPMPDVPDLCRDPLDVLGDAIVEVLRHTIDGTGGFQSIGALESKLREANIKFRTENLAPALDRLHRHGLIDSPPVAARKSRPGKLTLLGSGSQDQLED